MELTAIERPSDGQHRLDSYNIRRQSSNQQKKPRQREPDGKGNVVSKQTYIFCLCIESKKMRMCVGILLTMLVIAVGVLTVYFTAPRRSTRCELKYERIMKSSLIFSSQPQSVVSSDINNDREIDIVVANSGTDTIGIFMSMGNGTFSRNQQTYSTGSGSRPHSLAINDLNNDSYVDIVVANYGTNNIGLFLGYGNGTFDDQYIISLNSSHPLFVTTSDFNNDNRTDIAIVNNGTNTISVLLGYENGSFQHQITYFTGYDSLTSSLAIGDFNNDSYLDITVANSGTNSIGIFLNYGNGTFTNQQIYATGLNSNPLSIALGDFNNDNILDIVTANYGARSVGIFFGYGNGTFLSHVPYTINSNAYPQYVTVSDMDKDNELDIVIVGTQNDQIYVLPGYGNGSFATIATYDSTSGSMPMSISVTDLNNNKHSDVAVVNYRTNEVLTLMDYFVKPSVRQKNYHGGESGMLCGVAVSDFNNDSIIDIVFNAANYISILIGLGNSVFDNQRRYTIGDASLTQYVCTADINNDNRMDIIIADIGLDGIDVFLGYGNGSFGSMTTYSTGIGSGPWWVALGDFNDDNIIDMVSANTGTNSIGILLRDSNGNVTLTRSYYITIPYSIAVDDINRDNHLDIAVSMHSNGVTVYFGQGNATFVSMFIPLTSYTYDSVSLSLADFNRDNHLDIVVANTLNGNVGVSLGYGNGTFATQTVYSISSASRPYYVIVADCNNDNISDIITTSLGSSEVVIFYGYGNGSFHLARNYSTGFGSQPFGIATADLNNDTHLEFIVALYGPGDIAILTEYNAATFINKTVYSTGSAPQPTSLAIGDFNNDNQSDIVIANSAKDSVDIMLASTNRTFGTEMMYRIGTDSHPQYVMTGDINKDNQVDIVSVNSKMNSISVIMGYGNGSFAKQMIYPTGDHSSPYAVVAGDINNDNRLDLVVVNSGTDSIGILYGYDYTSFQSQKTYSVTNNLEPRGIAVGDFNNDDILDLAATFSKSDTWCIFFGYGNGSFTMPETYLLPLSSYPYGIGVGDFNNDNQSDIVITNPQSANIIVYLGYGNGSFSTITSYSTGTNSHPIAVAFGDFNNDSRLDIVVTNYFSANIGVLLGYGNGSFISIMIYSTGQGSSPTSVTVDDFNNDDRLDIAVTNNKIDNVGVLFGYGNGTFREPVIFSLDLSSSPAWLTVGDFNQDNQVDIATANFNTNNVGILLGYGNGSFASVVTYSTGIGSVPYCISVGDFNNDNISDIAVANYGTDNIVVLFGFGDGSFLLGLAYSTGIGSVPYAIANGDFNKDGRLDVAVANSRSSTIGIFLGDGSQPFAGVETYPTGDKSQPYSLALGDFNNDTKLDIVLANYGTDTVGILLRNNHKDFENITLYSTGNGSAPYSVAVSDFNNDTYLDIVVTNSETDNIVFLFGDGTGKFINGGTYSTGTRSQPYTVMTSDFNNDSITDIAVANFGTNNILLFYGYGNGTFGNEILYPFGYGYRPYSIAARLNENGWTDIVIAFYGSDHVETLVKMC